MLTELQAAHGCSFFLLTELHRTHFVDSCHIFRTMTTLHPLLYFLYLRVIHILSILYCTYGCVTYMLSAAGGFVLKGLCDLSDNMVSYYEKMTILDVGTMGTSVLGMLVQLSKSAAYAQKRKKCNHVLKQVCFFIVQLTQQSHA